MNFLKTILLMVSFYTVGLYGMEERNAEANGLIEISIRSEAPQIVAENFDYDLAAKKLINLVNISSKDEVFRKKCMKYFGELFEKKIICLKLAEFGQSKFAIFSSQLLNGDIQTQTRFDSSMEDISEIQTLKGLPCELLFHIFTQNTGILTGDNLELNSKDCIRYINSIVFTCRLFYNMRDELLKYLKNSIINTVMSYKLADFCTYNWINATAILLFSKNINPNVTNSFGLTPLILAIMYKFKCLASLLIENGVDVNAKDDDGNTALMLAIINIPECIARLIIEKNADINVRDSSGYTALMLAIMYNHECIASFLIEKDADINIKDDAGNTALKYAIMHKQERIAGLLIEKGADINNIYCWGRTALMLAEMNGLNSIVALIMRKLAQ